MPCYVVGMASRSFFVAVALVAQLAALSSCRDKIAGGRADGAAIFSEACARCHGPDGNPDPTNIARIGVKPLTSAKVQAEMTDDDIRRQIVRGSDNKQMPSFSGALSDAQIEAVIQHVRSLADPGGQPSAAGRN